MPPDQIKEDAVCLIMANGYGTGLYLGTAAGNFPAGASSPTAGYVANGTLTQDDAAVIAASMEQIDADKAAPEEDTAPPDTPDGVTYQD